MQTMILRVFFVLAGAGLGGALPAFTAARLQTEARWRGLARAAVEAFGLLAAAVLCAAAFPQAAPLAPLYTGLGAVWGGVLATPDDAQSGSAAACVWVCLCLPFTGALCCLAGAALGLLLERPALGSAAIPLLAAPVALLQFGTESAALLSLAAVCTLGRRLLPHHPPLS